MHPRQSDQPENLVWDPKSPRSWANMLGLVHVPLFGNSTTPASKIGDHAVLLDGHRASFAISAADNAHVTFDDEPLSWAWSANVCHLLTIDTTRSEMFLRRWDTPGHMRHFRLPRHGRGAHEFLSLLENSSEPKTTDVILHILKAFRQIRSAFARPIDSIHVLNTFLLGTEAVRTKKIDESRWLRCRQVNDAVDMLVKDGIEDAEIFDLSAEARSATLRNLASYFLTPDPMTGCRLEPALLLRHASSQLYQEAHLEFEREPQNLPLLFDNGGTDVRRGNLERDVRYTPTNLARSLVQNALTAIAAKRNGQLAKLTILDPACGSGVFLLEALRELVARDFTGEVTIKGIDKSPIACAIAKFCLRRATRELNPATIKATIEIKNCDSLHTSWAAPDVVVMNPPFVAWDRMAREDQESVRSILANRASGRLDKAMAFLWKAVEEVSAAGVIATVLPSPLLENHSGAALRQEIANSANLRMVGRFEGTGFFTGSMVETSFILLQKHSTGTAGAELEPIEVVLAKEGYEGAALRAVRLHQGGSERTSESSEASFEVYRTNRNAFPDGNWSPRSGRSLELISLLSSNGIATVEQLFDVKQGAHTGCNQAFVLSVEEFNLLPAGERHFFRPVAGNATIKAGELLRTEFVFYPYDEDGLSITSERELKSKLKKFYDLRLRHYKDDLSKRARIDQWWEFSEGRAWQRSRQSKLVSTYFGDRGSFGYDSKGSFIVLQGYGWLWKGKEAVATDPGRRFSISFHQSNLPYAYLAVLNSGLFERILECFCPRMQGGQFNLSKRFVNSAFLPDFTNETRVRGSLIADLAQLGQSIHEGEKIDARTIDQVCMLAYNLPARFLPLDSSL